MRRQYLTAFAAAILLASFAPQVNASGNSPNETDCKNATAQPDLNECAQRDFEAADKKLNAAYRKLLSGADGKEKALLQTAERNWIAFRDSECAYETVDSEGGSIQPMEYSECLTKLTEARINDLRK